ncbi:ATPase [Pseudothermotoga hypogea DSM 11164 = NBRC 106472]|uniref:ATPase n=1 Tax=Pseudothermotoga hypogea DSM 11164 = NBRC 106472 TaxID=1123384 RepID=A0A0X1KPM1_9THEM|nr:MULTISPECIES: ATP-binding protein [Pseudothermotoga]AJC73169.1 ATPase [Pseudothermotoga hypogea DSM 11164 = NBRC 106472]MBC7122672.1 ATP-binding protein [Pseudothermotoga sp.]MDI6861833.1 ATP-binding protein [Pseudothermotoga sp.]
MRVGVVTGINSSDPYVFYVRLEQEDGRPRHMLQIDDVVKVQFDYHPQGSLIYYGIVVKIMARWDFGPISGYEEELALKGLSPANPIFIATVMTTRMLKIESGKILPDAPQVPPPPGSEVSVASESELDVALGFDELLQKHCAIPIGLFRNNRCAYADVRYILGENGAHINISGQSGVAAKTSYATFLVKSFLDTGNRLKEKNELMACLSRSRFIIFNVKGEGLLFLDKWSKDWKEKEETNTGKSWKRMYEALQMKAEPFEKVAFFAPRKLAKDEPWVNKRSQGVQIYGWDIVDIMKLGLFELLFDQEELEKNQNLQLAVTSVQEVLQSRFEEAILEAKRFCERNRIKVPNDPEMIIRTAIANGFDVSTMARLPDGLDELIKMFDEDEDFKTRIAQEVQGKATVAALIRRLKAAKAVGFDLLWVRTNFLNYNATRRIDWDKPGQVTVIDISKLKNRPQSFVVGAVLLEVMRSREEKTNQDPVFIFLDELNKYAPRFGGGPLSSIFRDIAERGRSFRVILIGAEQTASEVDYRIITQSSTTVVGRQKGAELAKPEYSHLTDEQKARAALLQQGEVIVDQPFMRIPITVRFPLPAWCTREDDAYTMSEQERRTLEERAYGGD